MSLEPTIAIVDDDTAVVAALTALLTSFALQVISFASAEEFLETCPLEEADCLLLDVRLPGMNGLELHDLLVARGATIPTVFISGHADEIISARALAAGAAGFFKKPCDGRALHACIRRALKIRS